MMTKKEVEKYIDAVADESTHGDVDMIKAYIECVGLHYVQNVDADDLATTIDDSYMGEYDAEDFCKMLNDGREVPEWLEMYIDYDAMYKDYMHDFYEHDGYHFRAI